MKVKLYKYTDSIVLKTGAYYHTIKYNMGKAKVNQKEQDNEKNVNSTTHDHLFRIHPIKSAFIKEIITVNFQGKLQQCYYQNQTALQTKSSIQRQYRPITPKFNSDNKHYTSSFVLPYQDIESDQEMKQHHENKVIQSQKEIEASSIMVPKPKSKNQYCAVCHLQYEDYLAHIQAQSHKRNIKKSKFNAYIEYMALFMSQEINKQKDRVMTRSAKRKAEQLRADCQFEEQPNKKRKLDHTKPKKNIQEKEQLECQTPFNKRYTLQTTVKSLFKQLD